MDQGKLYSTQIPMTDWFARINHTQTTELRREDAAKRDRLKVLNQLIGLPFDEPYNFPATNVDTPTAAFHIFAQDHGDELCGLGLIPTNPSLPKIRIRGKTVRASIDWFHEQSVDPTKYTASFIPHSEKPLVATTFVVNRHGVFGEAIKGGHFQLTQGFYDEFAPVTFSYDWKTWQFSGSSQPYQEHIEELLSCIEVKDASMQEQLAKKLDATFAHNHLEGYFETMTNEDTGIWFVDYNRLLGRMYGDEQLAAKTAGSASLLTGQPASKGSATGKVRVVTAKALDAGAAIAAGEVLVCDITTPDYVPLIQKAAAVVTDRGGILSHAAIVCRELGKPCIAGTGNGTKVLKNGQCVTVDARAGSVTAA